MNGSPAPDVVLEVLACKCSKSFKGPDYNCINNDMKCKEMCELKMCENQPNDQEEEESDVEQSSDDELHEPEY